LFRHQANPGRKIPARSEGFGIGDAGDKGCRKRRSDPWNSIEPLAGLVRPVPKDQAPVKNANLLFERTSLNGEGCKAGAHKIRDAIVSAIINDRDQSIHASASHRGNDPELGKMRADRVRNRSQLADEKMPGPVQHQACLLLRLFDGYEAHAGPLYGLTDCLGIRSVVLCRLT
jgi:hypothetical protein